MEKKRNAPVVYISGKMTGKADYGRAEFNMAQEVLENAGYLVINPAQLPEGLSYEQYMRISMAMVDAADIIALLPDWKDSPGAQAEERYASCLKKDIALIGDLLCRCALEGA